MTAVRWHQQFLLYLGGMMMGGGQQPHNSMISYNTGQQPMARYPQGGQPPPQVPPGGAYNSQYGPQYQVYKSYFS